MNSQNQANNIETDTLITWDLIKGVQKLQIGRKMKKIYSSENISKLEPNGFKSAKKCPGDLKIILKISFMG